MNSEVKTIEQHIEEALLASDMAWWELEFPSGALAFSKNKTDMLGYDKSKFVHYIHFTDIIHPDDYDHAMKAMSDHYEGRLDVYETVYRMRHIDGHYLKFRDRGKVVERTRDGFIVAGIVQLITE